MKYPTLPVRESSRQFVDVFWGYNHNLRIGTNEFFDMKNMTSDQYPVLSPRKARGIYAEPEQPQGMITKDALCYVDGSVFVMNKYPVDMGLSTDEDKCPKQLISMGAYVIIMPDKMYINTQDISDWGKIDAEYESAGNVSFQMCTLSGEAYTDVVTEEPKAPKNLDLWIDTSTTPHTLKQWSESSAMWVAIATTYVKISSPGIGTEFQQYDGVKISGIVSQKLQDLNATTVIWERGEDYIIVTGILDTITTQTAAEGKIRVERRMPVVDFVTESENRLWGCRYGPAIDGQVVNEIYSCKLGDFKNWNCFMGLSTDSYAVSCGTDGQFTGAITHMGYPLFFKENCVHKVYGNYPANFQIQTTACRGVQKGCDKSLAIVNETLYYKGRNGLCAYDGSLPVEVSSVLGEQRYSRAVAGANGNKYYISMVGDDGEHHLFVYDTAKNLWHKEDDLSALCFCSCDGDMYCIDLADKTIKNLTTPGKSAEVVPWMVETGELGLSSPDMKYVSRMNIRMSLEKGAEAAFYIQYDLSGEWEHLFTAKWTSLRSFSVPIRPRRCDHMRLRIEGKGMAKIYSLTKTIEQGSELS